MFNYDEINNIFLGCIILYIPVVFILKFCVDKLNKESKKFLCDSLTYPWSIWCFSLSLFSLFGTYYTGMHIISNKNHFSEKDINFWYHAFLISKMPELIDTVFIVLRSKELVVLQYYHHWATLTIVYYIGTKFQCNEFIPYFFVNYITHFFMYFYFGIYPFYPKQTKKFGNFINVVQILQMLFAIINASYTYRYGLKDCIVMPTKTEISYMFYFGVGMYVSYFVLFIKLFFERSKRCKNEKKF